MGFDLVILVMTISGLWVMVPGGRGGLWKMLFADGVVYFTLVASVNSVPAVCPLSYLSGFFLPPYLRISVPCLGTQCPGSQWSVPSVPRDTGALIHHSHDPPTSTAAMNM